MLFATITLLISPVLSLTITFLKKVKSLVLNVAVGGNAVATILGDEYGAIKYRRCQGGNQEKQNFRSVETQLDRIYKKLVQKYVN